MTNSGRQKIIQIYPNIFKLHTSYKSLIDSPPPGYKFLVTPPTKAVENLVRLKNVKFIRYSYHLLLKIFKSRRVFESLANTSEIAKESDLVYAIGKISPGKKPFILEIIDNPFSITGYNYQLFIHNLSDLRRELSSPLCKKIVCSNADAIQLLKRYFPESIVNKSLLVHPGVSIQKIKKVKKHSSCRLLFVGSITNPQDFYSKGGLETIAAFEKISPNYDVELLMRCKIPEEIRARIYGNKKVTLIENEISLEELKSLYKNSDIFVLPGHHFHMMALLEAMSYGLPSIVLDTYGFSDFVEEGVNGYRVKKSGLIKGYNVPSYPTNVKERSFINDVKKEDPRVIDDIAEKIVYLAKNHNIRRKFSKASREIIRDRFSIELRNMKLKSIFDKALA